MAAVFSRYPHGGGEFVLALALADNAHDDGTHIFPSVTKMAEKSRQSVRQVQRHLGAMITSGWLLKVRNGGGRGMHTEYRISPEWLAGNDDILSPLPKAPELSTNHDKTSPIHTPERVTFTTKKGDIHDTKRVTFEAQKGDIHDTPIRTGRTSIGITPLPPVAGGTPGSVDNSPNGFTAFFAAYPRKVGKVQARQEWEKLAPDAALRKRIGIALSAWTRSPEWARNQGQFIPKPARWLREHRWDDEPGIAAAPPGAASTADPDSRLAIEAEGLRLGLGAWQQLDPAGRTVPWRDYADRVKARRAALVELTEETTA